MLAFVLEMPAIGAPLEPADFVSLGVLDPPTPITIDTTALSVTGGASFSGVLDGHVAVFTFDDIELDVAVTVVGRRPVALLSHGGLTLGPSGTIDARATDHFGGPGGFLGGAQWGGLYGNCFDRAGSGPGGGEYRVDDWGRFDNGGGGNGGAGGSGSVWIACSDPGMSWPGAAFCAGPPLGGAAHGSPVVHLLGGSGGARSVDIGWWGAGGPYGYPVFHYICMPIHQAGGGGGAVELGADGVLVVDGTIDVRGADSWDAVLPIPSLQPIGNNGGGGGAGGTALLHGAGGTVAGAVLASGGAGGDGFDEGGGGGGGGWIVLSGFDSITGTTDVAGGGGGACSGGLITPPAGESGEDGVVLIDSDGDFLDDDDEPALYGTDPASLDTDHGGLDDGAEVFGVGSDPTWGGDDGPVPLLVATTPPAAGATTILRAFGMAEGFPVDLRSSAALGTVEVAGCTRTTPTGLASPTFVADTATPGADRRVDLELTIPAGWTGTRHYVAVQPSSCRVSDVLTVTLP